jgi:hypothetical protein
MRTNRLFLRGRITSIAVLAGTLLAAMAAELDFRTDINPALLYFQAYQNMPQLSEEDTKHLFENWTGGAWPDRLDDRTLELLKQYDNSFKGLRRARFATVPCDWGYDLSDGPLTLLSGLRPSKRLVQVARFRAMAALDRNDFPTARDEMLAAYTLGRNLSRDGILISALVQIAVENIATSIVMENYYRLTAEQLNELVKGFDTALRRGTIADTIPTEHHSFYEYLLRNVQRMAAEAKGNEGAFWSSFDPFWGPISGEGTGPEPSLEDVKEVSKGSAEGVIRLLNEMPAYYTELTAILKLPYPEYKKEAPVYYAKVSSSQNPFIKQFFTLFAGCQTKYFSAVVREEMVRAAAAYKRGGMDALKAVQDPLVGGPFEFSRVEFEGVDRGFRLRSKEQFRDFDEVMIFLEKPGKHFRLDGKNAGTAR